ncbi:MAG: hypothetical protein FD124_3894, partial [Alphaproteobacteria bacterium]
MRNSIVVCGLLAWGALGASGCGDDSGSSAGSGGSGGSAGTSVDGGGGGTGGSGGSGGSGGTGGNFNKAQCLANSVWEVGAECLDCACTTSPNVTAQCDQVCWKLLVCVGLSCDGKLDDLNCIGKECAEYLGGATEAMAMVASPVILACGDVCLA